MGTCKICDWVEKSEKRDGPPGGLIQLDDYWFLNHYQGIEGFLGWMALASLKHRMDFPELSEVELSTLGKNIKRVDLALRDYWKVQFNDLIQRVYVVYFFETAFKIPQNEIYHLHIHLIPRPQSFDKLMRVYSEKSSSILAWSIYQLAKYRNFPEQYLKDGPEGKFGVIRLMDSLRDWFKRN